MRRRCQTVVLMRSAFCNSRRRTAKGSAGGLGWFSRISAVNVLTPNRCLVYFFHVGGRGQTSLGTRGGGSQVSVSRRAPRGSEGVAGSDRRARRWVLDRGSRRSE